MCGIFGCIFKDGEVAPIIHAALKRLEYRGYDSVGEVTIFGGRLHIKKDEGKIGHVHELHNLDDLPGKVGVGHTRWATHGAPYQVNAHPHTDCKENIAVVHNGIIENFLELKRELEDLGHIFKSKTDTEAIPHLIEENMKNGASLIEATREAVKRLNGSYAIAVLSPLEPDRIVCARKESPLALGISDDAVYCASDIPAFLPLTNKAVMVEDDEIAILRCDGIEIRRVDDWRLIQREPTVITWSPQMAEKQGYPHFMLKEIHEQPSCLRDTLRLQDQYLDLMAAFLDRAGEVFLVACGTSYHACYAASYMFSKLAYLATHPAIASEFI
ncbi:MAG: isomerizing glutamine--fructose-6-phosphate transaminase, partial [Candidatus Bathyarchaeia archaeon]